MKQDPSSPVDFDAVRADFPWASNQVYLDCGSYHPLGVHAARAIEDYTRRHLEGPVPGDDGSSTGAAEEVKRLYGQLVNADASELAFVQSTLYGENLVASALGPWRPGENIVTDELHYHGGIHIYRELARKTGVELRVVRQTDWRVDARAFEPFVDRNTRLVAISLVSNVTGQLHDARAIGELAHAHGACLYADLIQSAGCIPVDVREMGIDFCAAGTYKWLMGVPGLGFLYVSRERLASFEPMQFGEGYTNFQYHRLPGSPAGAEEVSFDPKPGAARLEIGEVPHLAVACQLASLRYILRIGVSNIRAHVAPLVERIRREVPRLGYPSITPADAPTPIAAFQVADPADLAARLAAANVKVKIKWNQMRVTPSVFTDAGDVDRFLEALA